MTAHDPQHACHNAFMASLRQAAKDAERAGHKEDARFLKDYCAAWSIRRGLRVDDPDMEGLAEDIEDGAAEIAAQVREQQTGELA